MSRLPFCQPLGSVRVSDLADDKAMEAHRSLAHEREICLRSARLLGWKGEAFQESVQGFVSTIEIINHMVAA